MTIVLFVLIFGVIVIGHELGHFLLAKVNGITVVEFSVGMGPKLLHFNKGERNIHCAFFLSAARVCSKEKTGLMPTRGPRRKALSQCQCLGKNFHCVCGTFFQLHSGLYPGHDCSWLYGQRPSGAERSD